ncbi:MAG: hypothetical protein KA969_17370, partial [Alicycliphilus sp.]|nr:hypothetical protein [Alicycliphilus sp.]
MARALIWDGMQGANHSDSRSYREDLQRCRPLKAGVRGARGTCSALPYTTVAPKEKGDLGRLFALEVRRISSAR